MVAVENKDFSKRGYVAPTVYLLASKFLSNYNYYGSLTDAINKLSFLKGWGGSNVPPIGMVSFVNNGTAQTFGINCDFYALIANQWQLVDYAYLKSMTGSSFPPVVFRFISANGTGPYYAIFDRYYFGLAATSVAETDPVKLAELDAYWREVQLLKYRYNSFVGFLNTLSTKQLNTVEQQIYNEGLLMLNTLSNQLHNIRGVYIEYDNGQKIGLPVVAIIIIIAVLSGVTAWTVSSIATEREKTKRINDSYDLQKWIVTKKQEIAQQVTAGKISAQSAAGINSSLDAAASQAAKIADNASKNKTIFGDVATIAKWGVLGYVAFLFSKQLSKNG